MSRKLMLIMTVTGVLAIAGLPAITTALCRLGVIPAARSIRAEYLTGTTLAVIVALLILLPSTYRISVARRTDQLPGVRAASSGSAVGTALFAEAGLTRDVAQVCSMTGSCVS